MTSGTMEYSHVETWQKDILSQFGDIIDTKGNDALTVLDQFQDTDASDSMKDESPDLWACGMSIASQVRLLSQMQEKGLIEQHSTTEHSKSSSTTDSPQSQRQQQGSGS